MRVKLGKSIHLCTKCTHSTRGHLLQLTTSNRIHIIDMVTPDQAKIVVQHLLTQGWYDFSDCAIDYQYSN